MIMLIKHIDPLNRSWPIYNQKSNKYICSVPVFSYRFNLKVWTVCEMSDLLFNHFPARPPLSQLNLKPR